MPAQLRFDVIGAPGAQGSKTGFVNKKTGRVIMIESSKKVRPWREDVAAAAAHAAAEQGWQPPAQVRARIVFYFRRPKHHYGTGRNSHVLRPNAPEWHSVKPDGDKLLRSTFDALTTAGVIGDDCQIVWFTTMKRYASADQPTGAALLLSEAERTHADTDRTVVPIRARHGQAELGLAAALARHPAGKARR